VAPQVNDEYQRKLIADQLIGQINTVQKKMLATRADKNKESKQGLDSGNIASPKTAV
jgi:hypothetical protein